MSPVELERRVRQLDNDVQSIYELLNSISSTQQRHTNRLGELAVKADGIEARIDVLDAKVDGLDAKVGTVDAKVDGLDEKLDAVLELLRGTPRTEP